MIYLILFFEFFKIGLFSVGGGLATLPFIYEVADKYSWLDRTILPDMIAISESTPGPIGVNMATYAGYNAAGILGGIIATIGLITPAIVIIMIIYKFLTKFSNSFLVKSAFYGLRPAVTALIAVAAFEVVKVSIIAMDKFEVSNKLLDLFNFKSILLFIFLYILSIKYKKHPIFYIGLAALIGVIFKF